MEGGGSVDLGSCGAIAEGIVQEQGNLKIIMICFRFHNKL